MSTIVIVKKGGKAVIGADSLTTYGNTKESAEYVVNHHKILSYKDNFIGISGTATLQMAVKDFLGRKRKVVGLSKIEEIFRFGLELHRSLKEDYFLLPDDEDSFETFHGDLLIINKKGIFGLSSYKYVQEYSKFAANGSGAEFALGAMYAVYDNENLSAREVAETGVSAGAEFDDGSGFPLTFEELKLA
ncbi:MAG: hypothetical protein R2684_12735 [Pyrinomonadaceae bacterium]